MKSTKLSKLGAAITGRGKLATATIIAVGLAVGGTAAADAAGSPSIPDRSIYHIDIAAGAVGSDTIANRAVQSYDMNRALVNALLAVPVNGVTDTSKIAAGAVAEDDLDAALQAKVNQVGTGEQGPKGEKGDQGEPGAKGDAGAAGAAGTDGVSGYEVLANEVVLPAGGADAAPVTVTATCPEGKVALGGGYKVDSAAGVSVFHSMGAGLTKTDAGTWISTGWDVKAQNAGGTKTNITAFVTCAAVS